MNTHNTNNDHQLPSSDPADGGVLLVLALLLALAAVAILVAAGAASGANPKAPVQNRPTVHRCCLCPCDVKDYHRHCIHRCDLGTNAVGKLLPMTREERAACALDCREVRSQKTGVRSQESGVRSQESEVKAKNQNSFGPRRQDNDER